MEFEPLSKEILDACISVHKYLGPGLLESIYEECLMKEFKLRGISAKNQVQIPIVYKGFKVSKDLKLDILVADEFILELKSVDIMHPVFEAQLLSYLRLSHLRVGFLINFNVEKLKDGFKRYVNNFL